MIQKDHESKRTTIRIAPLTTGIITVAVAIAATFMPKMQSPKATVQQHLTRMITPTSNTLQTDRYIMQHSAYEITNIEKKDNIAFVTVKATLPLMSYPIHPNDTKNEHTNDNIITNTNIYATLPIVYTLERKKGNITWTIISSTKPTNAFELSQLTPSERTRLQTTRESPAKPLDALARECVSTKKQFNEENLRQLTRKQRLELRSLIK